MTHIAENAGMVGWLFGSGNSVKGEENQSSPSGPLSPNSANRAVNLLREAAITAPNRRLTAREQRDCMVIGKFIGNEF